MKRPSSERPIDSDDAGRNDYKMFFTVNNNPSSDVNNDSSIVSQENSRSNIGTTPQLTNNFTHEAMLLSYGKERHQVKGNTFYNRAQSHNRGTINLNEILSNQSLLQSNMSQSTMIDSSRPIK